MKRININLFDNKHLWFLDMYGDPQEWKSTTTDPTALTSKHQWAIGGRTVQGDSYQGITRETCIWCSDEIFTMFALCWA